MSVHTILQAFDVILLDVNATFMFGQDRFGSDQDYAATYRAFGGEDLSDDRVHELVSLCVERMTSIGHEPTRYTDFPSVGDTLKTVADPTTLDPIERNRLIQVIAAHEVGEVPQTHASTLHELAESHRLGIVSNIWSEKTPWHRAFEAAGINKLFEVFIWSSDRRAIKPAPEIFNCAIAAIGAPQEHIVFVGDHPKRDIEGAKEVGLAAIWVDDGSHKPPDVEPDLVVGSLIELASTGQSDSVQILSNFVTGR